MQIKYNKLENHSAIIIKNLTKEYLVPKTRKKQLALNSVNLSIPKGCIFGLLGPNGAGKSTLINIISGTVKKDSGDIIVWNSNLDFEPKQVRASIGVVPQELITDVFLTPKEMLEFCAGLHGIKKSERITENLLKFVGLQDQANSYSRTLSGGMKRRLLIAKAMVHQPPILILDEPTAGVDVELRQSLWQNILDLKTKGITIVLTTHYLEEAQTLCDYISIINNGQIITSQEKNSLLKSMGRKEIFINIPSNKYNKLPKDISKLKPKIEKNYVKIIYNPLRITAGKILALFIKNNIQIGDVKTKEPDLEEVFLKLTK